MSSMPRIPGLCCNYNCTSANCVSSFDGMVSTSNQLDPKEKVVQVKTTEPIWWTVELRPSITKGAA